MTSLSSKTFWAGKAIPMQAAQLKSRYMNDQAQDRKLKWQVRKGIAKDGATSNLFPLQFNANAELHRYELEVIKSDKSSKTAVSPNRVWRMFAQSLRRCTSLPPIVRVNQAVYSASALANDILELDKSYFDLGWERCHLKYSGACPVNQIAPQEMKSIANKMLPWALNYFARKNATFAVVREVDGKMVCLDDGISVSGLRVYRGTTASIVHVDVSGNALSPVSSPIEANNVPQGRVLATLNQDGPVGVPLHVKCEQVLARMMYKDKPVTTYLLRDASGGMAGVFWGCDHDFLKVGACYELSGSLQVKKVGPGFKKGDFEFQLQVVVSSVKATQMLVSVPPPTQVTAAPAAMMELPLAVKLDTRCTVASEKSMWDEVKQHFGEPPYDDDKQRRIIRAVSGTPVVLSTTLRHTMVRSVRFDINYSAMEAPLDSQLREYADRLDAQQPYAVVSDYGVVPLQFLHCCFDPKMRSWQEITIPACSFLPERRGQVLETFRNALGEGLKQWNGNLQAQAFKTTRLAILEQPGRREEISDNRTGGQQQQQQHNQLDNLNRPKVTMVVSVANSRISADDKQRVEKSATGLARALRTQLCHLATSEQDAVAKVDDALRQGGIKPAEFNVVLVLPEQRTRAAYWLMSQFLRRGVMPTFVRGSSGDKKLNLLGAALRTQISSRFTTDPLKNHQVLAGLQNLAEKRVLVVGIDACHNSRASTGAVVGQLMHRNSSTSVSCFWRNDVRGKELEQATQNFANVVQRCTAGNNALDEVIVFQDGNVYSELESMKGCLPPNTGLSFLCLHKRTHIRFLHKGDSGSANIVKGALIQDLTPVANPDGALDGTSNIPSFYLQNHDTAMSTARTVQYTVHHESPNMPMADIQKLSFALSHVGSPQSTKLPFPTRCAHRLSMIAERLADANPDFKSIHIPAPLCHRMWFM